MLPKEIEKEVWGNAILRYENEVMWYSPASPVSPESAKRKDESVLEYASRTRALQREAMDKLEYALWRQKEVDGYFDPAAHIDLAPPTTVPESDGIDYKLSRDRIYFRKWDCDGDDTTNNMQTTNAKED